MNELANQMFCEASIIWLREMKNMKQQHGAYMGLTFIEQLDTVLGSRRAEIFPPNGFYQ
jgi:hypothetical protein